MKSFISSHSHAAGVAAPKTSGSWNAYRVAIIVCLITMGPTVALAGNIFDDDWLPPKLAEQKPDVSSVPAAPTTNRTDSPAPVLPSTNQAAAPAPASLRHPVPDKSQRSRSRALLKEAFAEQLKDRTAEGRDRLANTLLQEVPKDADAISDQFELLAGAIEASKEARNLPVCFSAADLMAEKYEVDGITLKVAAALEIPYRSDFPSSTKNAEAVLGLFDPLLAMDDYSTCAKLLSLMRPATDKTPSLALTARRLERRVDRLRAARERLFDAYAKLVKAPDDPAANLAVGSFTCFLKGRWDKGLPMLAKGSDNELKRIATLELTRPTSAADLIRLGDGWWDVSVKQQEPAAAEIRQHAMSLYSPAVSSATGLQRTVIQRRIATASTAEPASTELKDASTVFTNSIGMKFVRIPSGAFAMGAAPTDTQRREDEAQHRVTLTHKFSMQTTCVTQQQWTKVMQTNPSKSQGDDLPVDGVSWFQAIMFCQKLSATEHKKYRLPTEAEWEYACRAGSTTRFSSGDSEESLADVGWFNANSGGHTHPVAQKQPNAWGLYDMHGNVMQWCSDAYDSYHGAETDPRGLMPATDSSSRVVRGGSWYYPSDAARAAFREKIDPKSSRDTLGLRVCLDP